MRTRIFSAILAAVLAIGLSGCSMLFIHKPPEKPAPDQVPVCSTYLWPGLDIAWAAAHAAYAVGILVASADNGFCGVEASSSGSGCIKGYLLSVPFFTMAAIHGVSAGVGIGRNSKCREVRQGAVGLEKIGFGEDRYEAPKIKPPEIVLEEKKPEREPEDITGPMEFDLPMMEEREVRMKSLEEQLLEEEIKQLKEIGVIREGPAKADMLLKLAERYLEKYKQVYKKEMDEYDTKLKKWEAERSKNPDIPKPKPYNRGSKVWLRAAHDIFRVLLRNYQDYPRLDEVLFVFAYSLIKAGETQEGVERYRQLLDEFPKSRYVADTRLALGEHFFGAGDYESAKKEYEKSATYEGTKAAYLARYKLAWCYLRLGDKAMARAIMKSVAAEAKSEKLRDRARRELEAIFTDLPSDEESATIERKER